MSLLKKSSIQKKRHISAQILEENITYLCNTYKNIRPLGKGHLRGIHFLNHENNNTPIATILASIVLECQKKGLLILRTGTHGLRISPSFLCNPRTIQKAFTILSQVIKNCTITV